MSQSQISRRGFLERAAKTAAAAGVFTIVPRHVLGGPGYTAPSETLTRAVIGCGGMGKVHIRDYKGGVILAVCDVDEARLREALQLAGPQAQGYKDFREALDRPDIDIVHVPTPPHWHAPISIAAAQAGKDIWCEKPMTRTIAEGEKVVEAVRRYGRIFRINTWFRFESIVYGSGMSSRDMKKIVQARLLGWPLKVVLGSTTGFNWKFQWIGKTDLKPEPVPAGFDYDMWLGPAPFKPYHPHRTHGTFRGYWDYDGGGLGDMGQHYLDPIQYILEKDNDSPVEIEVDAPQQHPDAVGDWRRIVLRYADGCEIVLDGEGAEQGAPLFEGPKGKLFKGLESTIPDLRRKIESLPDPEPQLGDFLEAVRTRRKFALDEEKAHRSCTLVNLAKIAVQLGRNLTFDPATQRFPNDEQANRLADQPMRAPWRI